MRRIGDHPILARVGWEPVGNMSWLTGMANSIQDTLPNDDVDGDVDELDGWVC